MSNVKNLPVETIVASAFGSQDRPLTPVNIADVEHVHEEMLFYGIETGEIVRFLPKYDQVHSQKVSANSTGVQYLVPVEREKNGVKTNSLFNLNTLNKRDADGNYVHKEIVKAGPLPKRLALLCSWGAIIGGEAKPFDVASFDGQTGKRNYETVERGGKFYKVPARKVSDVVMIEKYEG